MNKVKILVVDDHPMVREGLRQMLETDKNMKVIGEAESGRVCLNLLEKGLSPDVILMDIKMDGFNGIEATNVITRKYPYIKVIILTVYKDDQYISKAIESGAQGYILKNVTRNQLLDVINKVMSGQAYLDTIVTATLLKKIRNDKSISQETARIHFTQRELEVIETIVAGKTDREIADELKISEHTVRSHIKKIFRKLCVSTRAHAVAKVIKDGIVCP